MYKVFLVEDEIVTREGIRDNVDWKSADFEFCGEAPDGEIALPLIEALKPDVLITDIRMPFMDGLQLSKVIREQMPWIKVIILSGHNEFEYAQAAVKLGVTEYLLKPVSAEDLSDVLIKLSATLDREKQERESLKHLQNKAEDNMVLAREKFLLRLVMGGVSSVEAVEQSLQFGLDIVARYYLVMLIHIELCDETQPFDFYEYQHVERLVSSLTANNSNVFLAKKGMEELVLLIKGNDPEQIQHAGHLFARLTKQAVEDKTTCGLMIEMGELQNRLGDIHHSFAEALAKVKSQTGESPHKNLKGGIEQGVLFKIDHQAIENYLNFGTAIEFDEFFADCIQPIGEAALRSYQMKHYLLFDIFLTAAQFVSDLGGDENQAALDLQEIEDIIANVKNVGGIKEVARRVLVSALTYRNNQANHERSIILHQAKDYIDHHFTDPELKLSRIASMFHLSPSYFSTVFRQELEETFRDYLSKIRINQAKELLRTTHLKSSEVAYRSGYNDSHYFSATFKRKTGLTPQQFRELPQKNKQGE